MSNKKKLSLGIALVGLLFFLGNSQAKQLSQDTLETITYDVRLGKLYLGKAKFQYHGKVNIKGQILNSMTFETNVVRFYDIEKIYSDPKSLLPVRIERNIRNFLKKEQIAENYDQKNFTLTITKNNANKEEQIVIKKQNPIHNAILFPYSVRYIPDLKIGGVMDINLPSRRLEVKLVSVERIKVPAGTFNAYYFESTPREIRIWISTDQRKIPIKIEGSGIFGYTLSMREYSR